MTITSIRASAGGNSHGSASAPRRERPVLVGIVGDSAAGKTTLTDGIVNAFGSDRVASVCTDDYHRYSREQRKGMTLTPLHPDGNYIDIMEQHLQLLAAGEPILKPVYNHNGGTLDAPELVEPADIIVVEGLLAYHTKAMRNCFDVKIYLDPPEDLRRRWKIQRDCSKRGYTEEQVLIDLDRREGDSAAFIRPQRDFADIVVRFHPPAASLNGLDPTELNVRLVMKPTLPHPYLIQIADETRTERFSPIRLTLARDGGKPVDLLEVDGRLPPEVSANAERIIWSHVDGDDGGLDRSAIGRFTKDGEPLRSESLALTQLLLITQLLGARLVV